MKELDINKVYDLRKLTTGQKEIILENNSILYNPADDCDFIEFDHEECYWYGFKTTDARELFNEE